MLGMSEEVPETPPARLTKANVVIVRPSSEALTAHTLVWAWAIQVHAESWPPDYEINELSFRGQTMCCCFFTHSKGDYCYVK